MTFRKCPLRTDVAGAGETSESHAFEAELDRVAGGMPPQAPGKETPPPPPRDPHPIYPF